MENRLLVFVPMVFGRCGSTRRSAGEAREGQALDAAAGTSAQGWFSPACAVFDPRVGRLL